MISTAFELSFVNNTHNALIIVEPWYEWLFHTKLPRAWQSVNIEENHFPAWLNYQPIREKTDFHSWFDEAIKYEKNHTLLRNIQRENGAFWPTSKMTVFEIKALTYNGTTFISITWCLTMQIFFYNSVRAKPTREQFNTEKVNIWSTETTVLRSLWCFASNWLQLSAWTEISLINKNVTFKNNVVIPG